MVYTHGWFKFLHEAHGLSLLHRILRLRHLSQLNITLFRFSISYMELATKCGKRKMEKGGIFIFLVLVDEQWGVVFAEKAR